MVSGLEDPLMKVQTHGKGTSSLLAAAILIWGLWLAGCDDHITVIRDPDIPVHQGNTWAWRPVAAPKDADRRPVVSRDVISRGETIARDPGTNNEIVRQRIRTAIELPPSFSSLSAVGRAHP
jgi:hypothetical protein